MALSGGAFFGSAQAFEEDDDLLEGGDAEEFVPAFVFFHVDAKQVVGGVPAAAATGSEVVAVLPVFLKPQSLPAHFFSTNML